MNKQKHSITIIMFLSFVLRHLILSENIYGSESWHEISLGIIFAPGIFFRILFETLGLFLVLVLFFSAFEEQSVSPRAKFDLQLQRTLGIFLVSRN